MNFSGAPVEINAFAHEVEIVQPACLNNLSCGRKFITLTEQELRTLSNFNCFCILHVTYYLGKVAKANSDAPSN
jgi:hypothetical protein